MSQNPQNAVPALLKYTWSDVDRLQTGQDTKARLEVGGTDENEALTATPPIHLFPSQARDLGRRLIARADEIEGSKPSQDVSCKS